MTPEEGMGFSSRVLPQRTDSKVKGFNPKNRSIGSLQLEDLGEIFDGESEIQNSERDD